MSDAIKQQIVYTTVLQREETLVPKLHLKYALLRRS